MSAGQEPLGEPLIRLRGITKIYGEGQAALAALKGIDLDIAAGEFVAVMGPSGSGKSTAMNIIGCLDTPTTGEYIFDGVHVEKLTHDERAQLRRSYLGFVFQGFNLLSRTSAQENVELPLLYRGQSADERHAAAREALASVGLEGWEHHAPSELSGGQQQRVAIARAMVTQPAVLVADEPTGNLDTQRSREIMELLVRLNVDHGITIVMVTHEPDMAAYAKRTVRFVDGMIQSDEREPQPASRPIRSAAAATPLMWLNAISLALRSIRRNTLRSILTMLGIVIGVAAVITMVTLGNGASQAVQNQILSLGTNLLMVRPGQRLGAGVSGVEAPYFTQDDAAAVATQIGGISAVAPEARSSVMTVANGRNWSTSVVGSTNSYFETGNWKLAAGRTFTAAELQAGAAVCVIGETIQRELFGGASVIGELLRIKRFSCQIVGLLTSKGRGTMGNDQDDIVLVPLRTLQRRVTGDKRVATLLVSMQEGSDTERVKASLTQLLRERRKLSTGDDNNFNVLDTRQLADTLSGTTKVMTLLLGAVAAVSLVVGGIGIMNIMLVSVTERTREIGLRLAIGAMGRDVLLQFLVEAMVLAALGGLIGVVLAAGSSIILADLMQVPYLFGPVVNILSFAFSAGIGVVFGYFPAHRAARLDPIEALRHE